MRIRERNRVGNGSYGEKEQQGRSPGTFRKREKHGPGKRPRLERQCRWWPL